MLRKEFLLAYARALLSAPCDTHTTPRRANYVNNTLFVVLRLVSVVTIHVLKLFKINPIKYLFFNLKCWLICRFSDCYVGKLKIIFFCNAGFFFYNIEMV